MNEANLTQLCNTVLSNSLDRNEMYTIEYLPGSTGGVEVTVSEIYNNNLYRKNLLFSQTMTGILDENIVKMILSNLLRDLRILGVQKHE